MAATNIASVVLNQLYSIKWGIKCATDTRPIIYSYIKQLACDSVIICEPLPIKCPKAKNIVLSTYCPKAKNISLIPCIKVKDIKLVTICVKSKNIQLDA